MENEFNFIHNLPIFSFKFKCLGYSSWESNSVTFVTTQFILDELGGKRSSNFLFSRVRSAYHCIKQRQVRCERKPGRLCEREFNKNMCNCRVYVGSIAGTNGYTLVVDKSISTVGEQVSCGSLFLLDLFRRLVLQLHQLQRACIYFDGAYKKSLVILHKCALLSIQAISCRPWEKQ